jgi:hypothetical protein
MMGFSLCNPSYFEIFKLPLPPFLLIKGEVKCVGKVPPRNSLKKWLLETQHE